MRLDYELNAGRIVEDGLGSAAIRVYSEPTGDERAELSAFCGLDEHTLNSMLDPEEVPRIEVERDHTLVIWKQPNPASLRVAGRFEVSSVGLMLYADHLVIVTADDAPTMTHKRSRAIASLNDLLLQLLLDSVHHFLDHLRVIKHMAQEVQSRLNSSVGNEHLLQMFALGESLIFYVNAIESNGGMLLRLRASADRIGMSADDVRLLEDVIIENNQCARQAAIYSEVLSGLMDARGNIINNNMNMLLKNLTIVNVVFLPMALLVGIGGMSEYTMATQRLPWWLSYPLFLLAMGAIGLATWWGLRVWMDRTYGAGGGSRRK